ncbi:MAG: DNA topoisomerase III [Candidatus Handelsmanbacteria bacterium]|nr:DNA topoisomerase III [Candidatus Handelsmanbacteria bacterium]
MDQLAYGSTSAAVRKAKTDTGTHKNGSKEKKKPPGQSKSTFLAPLQPSVALAAIVGSGPLPRTQVVKRLWRYIRRHGLQDAGNKRMINADGVLRKVLDGKKQVSMFDMIKLVNKHLS